MKIKTNKTTLITNCPICNEATTKLKDNQLKVDYLVCQNCGFIYKDKKFRIDVEEEAKNYSLHNNSFECEGYVKIFIDLIKEYITQRERNFQIVVAAAHIYLKNLLLKRKKISKDIIKKFEQLSELDFSLKTGRIHPGEELEIFFYYFFS